MDKSFIDHLKSLGAVWYDFQVPETKAIPAALTKDERVDGLVYGRYRYQARNIVSRGVLISTNERIILLNKKPLFEEVNDISYKSVSMVSLSWIGLMGIVILGTKMGDIRVRTFNKKAARIFVKAVEENMEKS